MSDHRKNETTPEGQKPDIDMRPSYEDVYKQLHLGFTERLNNSLAELDEALAREPFAFNAAELKKLMHTAHGLAGSGTTFGHPRVTEAGQKLDLQLSRWLKNPPDNPLPDNEEDATILHNLIQALRSAASAAAKKDIPAAPSPEAKPQIEAFKDIYNVMIVDDDKHLSDLLMSALRQRSVRVTQARDGEAAMELMSRGVPDLIILDITMPRLNGHEVLSRLKKDPRLATIPVIMLTGKTEQEDVVSAIYSGAIDYIVKPVDIDKLVGRIEKTLYAARHTVLIADNDHLILQLLENRYKGRGFKVLLADDGKKALDTALARLPDIIILDRMMPGLDGLAVLKTLREESATKNIPVILLSARKEERDIEMGKKMGAQDYIAKPFLPDDLINRSIDILKSKG